MTGDDGGTISKVTVVLGAQWGDEGKGKVVDMLAMDADVVCRCQVLLISMPPISTGKFSLPRNAKMTVRESEPFGESDIPRVLSHRQLIVERRAWSWEGRAIRNRLVETRDFGETLKIFL